MSRPGAFTQALCLGAVLAWAAPRASAPPDVIRISTLPALRYDTTSFSVRPGVEVELVFSNYDEMLHNLVITRPGARARVVQAALALGGGAADRDFVPPTSDVLWATKVVATDQSAVLRFTAPMALGDYPYVCTLPGHGLVMFGTMVVTHTPGPPVMTPVEPAGSTPTGDHGGRGAASTRATVVRTFMPDAGPAAIAVQLPGGVSYVFDAGAARFRYAWMGDGVIVPSSPERGMARLTGDVFYRETGFPLRLGTSPSAPPSLVTFKGYTRDGDGIPEFEIVVDGVTVRERVVVRDRMLARRFRITNAATVWFAVPDGAIGFDVSGGQRDGAFFRLTGAAAQEFVVTHALPNPALVPR